MPQFSVNQMKFLSSLVHTTGLNSGVVAAWMAAEEPVGANSGYGGTQNWLNVGITDSGPRGERNSIWSDPVAAGTATGKWLKGQLHDPGFGSAAPAIRAIANTVGQAPEAQISAIQKSGWASSGYPGLQTLFNQYGHSVKPIAVNSTPTPNQQTTAPEQTLTTTSGGQPDWTDAGVSAFLRAASRPIDTSGKVSTNAGLLNNMIYQAENNKTPVTTTKIKVPAAAKASAKLPGSAAPGNLDFLKLNTVANFGDKQVAGWIAPILQYAQQHGWTGTVNSGLRTYAEQKAIYDSGKRPAAVPGTSNHEMKLYPGGAVDVSQAQQLSDILSKSPYKGILVWAGGKDPVHFSHPHGGHY